VSCVELKKKCYIEFCVWSSSRDVRGEEREGLWEREKRKGKSPGKWKCEL